MFFRTARVSRAHDHDARDAPARMDGNCLIRWTFASVWLKRSRSRACRVTRRRRASTWRSVRRLTGSTGIAETGSVAPGQIGGYRPKKLVGEHRDWLLQRCRDGDFTLRGLVAELADRGLQRGLSRGLGPSSTTRSSVTKKDADRQRARSSRRGAATPAMEGVSGSDRSCPPGLHRRDLDQDQYGAAARLGPRGQRLPAKVPHGRWTTMTFLAALRHDRVEAPWLIDGPINGQSFRLYIDEVLIPTLAPGDIVVMDPEDLDAPCSP